MYLSVRQCLFVLYVSLITVGRGFRLFEIPHFLQKPIVYSKGFSSKLASPKNFLFLQKTIGVIMCTYCGISTVACKLFSLLFCVFLLPSGLSLACCQVLLSASIATYAVSAQILTFCSLLL